MHASLNNHGMLHQNLSYQISLAFIFRDMERARLMADAYIRLVVDKNFNFKMFHIIWYDALISFHFIRETNDETWRVRARDDYVKIKDWSKHSKWNFENKLLLLDAELHNTRKEIEKAVECYDAAIASAREHR